MKSCEAPHSPRQQHLSFSRFPDLYFSVHQDTFFDDMRDPTADRLSSAFVQWREDTCAAWAEMSEKDRSRHAPLRRLPGRPWPPVSSSSSMGAGLTAMPPPVYGVSNMEEVTFAQLSVRPGCLYVYFHQVRDSLSQTDCE